LGVLLVQTWSINPSIIQLTISVAEIVQHRISDFASYDIGDLQCSFVNLAAGIVLGAICPQWISQDVR
jgi:hypothetical protein